MIGNVLIHSFRTEDMNMLVLVCMIHTSMAKSVRPSKLAHGTRAVACNIYYSLHTVDVQFLYHRPFGALANNVYWRLCQKGFGVFCWRTDRFYGFPLLARFLPLKKETESGEHNMTHDTWLTGTHVTRRTVLRTSLRIPSWNQSTIDSTKRISLITILLMAGCALPASWPTKQDG